MKKKAGKKKPLKRRTPKAAPGKIGGRNGGSGLNWARVGRRRKDDDTSVADLGVSLKLRREEKGESVSKVAKQLGIAPATLIKFEDKGHPVSIKVVSAFAKHLGYEIKVVPTTAAGKKKKK